MNLEVAIISAMRILGALPVLRWAFAGAIIAILVDLSDLFAMNLLDLGGFRDYQSKDKWLDQAYLVTFLVVALRWRGPVRTIAIALFLLRIPGFIAFHLTDDRRVLLLFPNVFEFWFVFVAAALHWRPAWLAGLGRGGLAIALAATTAAKLAHEYVLHVAKALDGFTAVEAVQSIWRWVTPF